MDLPLAPGSHVATIDGATTAVERYNRTFGVRPENMATLASSPLRIVGSDTARDVRVVKLPGHPFFIGTLYVPQAGSTPAPPHPLVSAFLRFCCRAGDLRRVRQLVIGGER